MEHWYINHTTGDGSIVVLDYVVQLTIGSTSNNLNELNRILKVEKSEMSWQQTCTYHSKTGKLPTINYHSTRLWGIQLLAVWRAADLVKAAAAVIVSAAGCCKLPDSAADSAAVGADWMAADFGNTFPVLGHAGIESGSTRSRPADRT